MGTADFSDGKKHGGFHDLGNGFKLPDFIAHRIGNNPLESLQINNLREEQLIHIFSSAGFSVSEELLRQAMDSISAGDFSPMKMITVCGSIFPGYTVRENIEYYCHKGKPRKKNGFAIICHGTHPQDKSEMAGFTAHIRKSAKHTRDLFSKGNSARFNITFDFYACGIPPCHSVAEAQRHCVSAVLSRLQCMTLSGSNWLWRQYDAPSNDSISVRLGHARLDFTELDFSDLPAAKETQKTLSGCLIIPGMALLGEVARRCGIPWEKDALIRIRKLIDNPELSPDPEDYSLLSKSSRRPVRIGKTVKHECGVDSRLLPSVMLSYTDNFNPSGCVNLIVSNLSAIDYLDKKQARIIKKNNSEVPILGAISCTNPGEHARKMFRSLAADLKRRKLLIAEPEDWDPDLWG